MPWGSSIRYCRGKGLYLPPGPLEEEHLRQLRTTLLEPGEEILWHEFIPETALVAHLAHPGWHYLLTTHRLGLLRGTENPDCSFLDLENAGVIALRGVVGGPGHLEVADKISQRSWLPGPRFLQASAGFVVPLYSQQDITRPYHLLRRQCRRLAGVDDAREIPLPDGLPAVDREHVPGPLLAVLDEGERVLWHGKPIGGEWRLGDVVSMLFGGLLIGAVSVFLHYQVRHWQQMAQDGLWLPVVALLAAMALLGIGALLCVGPFFWQRKRTARYHYAITNQRVLVLNGSHFWPIRSLERPFGPLRLRAHRGGRGTLRVGERPEGLLALLSSQVAANEPFTITLLKVPQAQAVLELLQRLNRP